jgi:hypothetical protein
MIDNYGWHGSVSLRARIQEMRTGRKLVAASCRDIMRPDGSREKRLLHFPNYNEAFSYAEEDVKSNWERYRREYLREEEK